MKLLIVEDDLLLQEGLALGLTNEGYALDCAGTAAEADALIQSGEYSLVILDLGLPDKDGATLLSQWRRRGIANPVLILTARDAIEDRITGLDAGADDYLVKPFALAELQARVRALIRRYQGHSDNLLTDGDITLNLQTQQVLRRDQAVEVTLQQDIYSWQDDPGSNTLEVHIHNLRRKLGKDRIKTVRGVGYRLESQK